MKGRIILLVAIGLFVVSCGSGGNEETTTTDPGRSSTTATIDELGTSTMPNPVGGTDEVIDELSAVEMCRGLDLLANAGVRPSVAAVSISTVDMEGMTSTEMAQYSKALSSATVSTCPELAEYAVEVVYWLGF